MKMVIYVCEVFFLSIRIQSVTPGSPAFHAGIHPDEYILSINGEPVLDEIDYQALSMVRNPMVEIADSQSYRNVPVSKEEWEPLGLCLDETEAMKPRHCRNRCVFCFVDQLPEGMRDTLYVKDDDWRLSLMMGNYVTLTNVSDEEFARILARKASPLYISVHATDPDVRCMMLNNPHSGNLMDRLCKMKEHGLQYHCQIVLCPGINDGDVLKKTIEDLAGLYPAAQSIAIVPVGLTKHRKDLHPLLRFDAQSARNLIELVREYQNRFLDDLSTRFVYASDEFYCLSSTDLPSDPEYEDYPQIENGVGMLRLLEQECMEAYDDLKSSSDTLMQRPRKLLIPSGTSAAPYIRSLSQRYSPPGTQTEVVAVHNHFFGETITVTGLIVGQDLISALQGIDCDQILICDTMLRDQSDRFLDDMTLKEVKEILNKPVRIVHNNGESLIRALWGMEDIND